MAWEELQASIAGTRAALHQALSAWRSPRAVLGLDGFVDEILHVVDTRTDAESYTRVETIGDLAERIARARGLSTNIELVPVQVKLGGNGPIMANALVALGFRVTYIGALGFPELHPVFRELAARAEVISVAEPAHTDALEFNDGKIMLGKMEPLKGVHWQALLQAVGRERLARLLAEADLVGWQNWTMVPYMTEIWEHLLTEVLPQLPPRPQAPLLFFDLADPEKRPAGDIRRALSAIQAFSPYYRVILGLNLKEANHIAHVLGAPEPPDSVQLSIEHLTRSVAEATGLYGVVVHAVAEAACVIGGDYHHTPGPYTARPRLTTGAGDNFNAGLVTGLLLGLHPQQSLVLATAASGFYVRAMRSPALEELAQFLTVWERRAGSDFTEYQP